MAKVRVGGIVLAKLSPVVPASECKVERLVVTGTGREKKEADLDLVRLLYKVTLQTSGRRITDLDDYSPKPWEPGGKSVELPGYVVEQVIE